VANITRIVEDFVRERPSVRDCLTRDIVNYSKLSRLILKEIPMDGKDNFDAVLIAARRVSSKLKKEKQHEKEILAILRASRIEMRNRVTVAVLEADVYWESVLELQRQIKRQRESINVIQGSSTITLVTTDLFSDEVKRLFKSKVVRMTKGLNLIIIKSPEALEQVPGVLAYLTGMFAERGINLVETMSCWTDTLFVVDMKDTARAMDLLRF